jgi:hypothetical protein
MWTSSHDPGMILTIVGRILSALMVHKVLGRIYSPVNYAPVNKPSLKSYDIVKIAPSL